MKALSFFLMLLMILSLAVSCCAMEIPENYTNEITALDFYPAGAKFTFRITSFDDDGKFSAYIPGAFRAESIRLLNPENIYGDIKVKTRSRTKWTPPQLEALKAQADEQGRIVNDLTARQEALEQTLTLLKNSKPESAKPAELLEYIKDAQNLRLDTENDLYVLKIKIAQEKEKLAMLNNELNSERPAGENRYIVITGRAKGTVIFEAFTYSASWSPEYMLNLDSETGDINVDMYAAVLQRTGLDYDGKITLHTKTPDENITNPELNPIKVSIKPKEESIASTSLVSYSRTNRMYKSVKEAEEDNAVYAEADAIENGASVLPAVRETLSDRTVNINGLLKGDGNSNKFEVIMNKLMLKSIPVIMLIPEQRSNAWIIASMDEGNEHLIPGMAELRVDNHSSGRIYLEEFGEGQRKIPFGYAEQITVKKEALLEKTGVSWFSGVFTSGYKLEITNGTKENRKVTIKDRLPVPTDEKIKLDVKRIDPRERTRSTENILEWEFTVPAGGTVNIIVDYTLSYPSGEELQYK